MLDLDPNSVVFDPVADDHQARCILEKIPSRTFPPDSPPIVLPVIRSLAESGSTVPSRSIPLIKLPAITSAARTSRHRRAGLGDDRDTIRTIALDVTALHGDGHGPARDVDPIAVIRVDRVVGQVGSNAGPSLVAPIERPRHCLWIVVAVNREGHRRAVEINPGPRVGLDHVARERCGQPEKVGPDPGRAVTVDRVVDDQRPSTRPIPIPPFRRFFEIKLAAPSAVPPIVVLIE